MMLAVYRTPVSYELSSMTWLAGGGKMRDPGNEVEHPPGVRDAMGSIPVRDSDFFFVSRSSHADQFTFHILLPRSKLTIFIYLSTWI